MCRMKSLFDDSEEIKVSAPRFRASEVQIKTISILAADGVSLAMSTNIWRASHRTAPIGDVITGAVALVKQTVNLTWPLQTP